MDDNERLYAMEPCSQLEKFQSPAAADLQLLGQQARARLFKANDIVSNVSLKFQTLIYQIRQYFLLKKM